MTETTTAAKQQDAKTGPSNGAAASITNPYAIKLIEGSEKTNNLLEAMSVDEERATELTKAVKHAMIDYPSYDLVAQDVSKMCRTAAELFYLGTIVEEERMKKCKEKSEHMGEIMGSLRNIFGR